MKQWIGMCFLAFACLVQAEIIRNPDANTLWQEDGREIKASGKWGEWLNTNHDIKSDNGGGFRLISKRPGNTGCALDFHPDYPYTVMKISEVQPHPNQYVAILFPTFPGLKFTGMGSDVKILPGTYLCNLYENSALPKEQKNTFLSIYLYGADLKIDYLKQVKIPENLFQATEPKRPLQNGDQVDFNVKLAQPAKKVIIRFYQRQYLTPLKINGQDSLALIPDETGHIFTGSLKLNTVSGGRLKKGDSFKAKQLLLVANIDDTQSNNLIIPNYYDWNLNMEPVEKKTVSNHEPSGNALNPAPFRQLWAERTKGSNLALGKKVLFSVPPTYHLTQSKSDPYDLTDGKLSSVKDDLIWFGKDSVGWFGSDGADNGINFLIDLGSVKPVKNIVIRCLGGALQTTLAFPKSFDVFVSKDGKKFYRSNSMQKLQPAEKSQSDFQTAYFLEEPKKAYVYPFQFNINADARYVGFTIASETGGLFCDQLAVIEGQSNPATFNHVYGNRPESFHISGILVKPRLNEFVVSANIVTPNFFLIQDMRTSEQRQSKIMLNIEAPEGLSLIEPKPTEVEHFTNANGQKSVRIAVPVQKRQWSNQQIRHLYFKLDKALPENAKAVFYSVSGNLEPIRLEFPIKSIEIPEVPKLKRMHVSLAWMSESDARSWPHFFDHWSKLGFNSVSSFPRYWKAADIKNGNAESFLNTARERNFKVVMNESPLHQMKGYGVKGHEVNCPVPGLIALCPSYRGKFYQEEIARVYQMVKATKPDYVFWDIEAWYNSHISAQTCPRCQERRKSYNQPMEQYVKTAATEIMSDLHNAVVQAARETGIPCPIIGSYGQHPSKPDMSQQVLDYSSFYPKYVNLAQPSLYVGGHPEIIRETIRADYRLLKNRQLIPWLTAGTYGEYDPEFLEFIVLESFLNGAGGITYYCFTDFDTPMDYYYHAKALALLAPYEDLIMDGAIADLPADNPEISVSALKQNNQMLILLGNYTKAKESVKIQLPFKNVVSIQDIRDGEKFPAANEINLKVPKARGRLLYVVGK